MNKFQLQRSLVRNGMQTGIICKDLETDGRNTFEGILTQSRLLLEENEKPHQPVLPPAATLACWVRSRFVTRNSMEQTSSLQADSHLGSGEISRLIATSKVHYRVTI
jgi:hypothetical protein